MKASFDFNTIEGKIKAFNAKSATSGSLKDYCGELLSINGLMTYVDESEVEPKNISTLFLSTGEIIGGQSAQTFDQINELIDLVDGMDIEKNPITVTIIKGKSKNERDFLQLKLVSLG